MGEVYRATDTKLKRQVAIKVLPAALAADPDRLARFQREAEVLALLNHPHIAAIYGLEAQKGEHALVMELVEGDDLSERIRSAAGTPGRGPGLPLDEVLAFAKQIASALEGAHEAGIIHRDLKPANIKVRPDGTVKVLDFGLAKLTEQAGGAVHASGFTQSPTITTPAMTGMGIILGTAAYMSPEQARGRAVDKRTDIWAFGVVLYEMLTGRRAFEGEDVSLTLASVMKSDPDLALLPRDLPPAVRACLARCLHKDPRQRLRDIGDFRLALEGAFDAAAPTPAVSAAPMPVKQPLWRRVLAPITAAVIAGTAMGIAGWYARPPEPRPVTRFEHVLPGDVQLRGSARRVIAVSPDGRRLAYIAVDGIYVHEMNGLADRQVLKTASVINNIAFSPDGTEVAFHEGGLKRMAITGGTPIAIAATPSIPFSLSWAENDTILFSTSEGISRVRAQGGTVELIVRAAGGEALSSPQLLPGGDTVLFSAARILGEGAQRTESAAAVQSLSSGQRKVLVAGALDARYVRTGHLLYTVQAGLFAVPIEVGGWEVVGGAVALVESIVRGQGATPIRQANFDVSDDGSLFYLAGGAAAAGEPLVWATRDGKSEAVTSVPPSSFDSPRLSSDGKRLLVVAEGDVRIYDLATGRETRVTSDQTTGAYAEWVPGEQAIVYSSSRNSKGAGMNVWLEPLDGSGRATQLTALAGLMHVDGWTPDGRVLAVHHHPDISGKTDLLQISGTDAATKPKRLFETPLSASNAVFSPDGRFVAYVDNVSGRGEVVIRPFPGPGPLTPVSVGGAREPTWAPNGELFYRRSGDDMMMAVRVATSPALAVGPPTELFRGSGSPAASPRAS
jgi:serine/threonine-protein kinase